MDASLIVPVIATVLLTTLLIWRHGETVENAYNTFDYLRKTIGAILLVLVAWTFLQSGNGVLYVFALGLVVLATVWFGVERPDKDIV